jgi:uncharacterized protein
MKWIKTHKLLSSIFVFAVLFIFLNIFAYLQVYSMSHYAKSGTRSLPPEQQKGLMKMRTLLLGVTIPKPLNYATPDKYGMSYSSLTIQNSSHMNLVGWWIQHAKPKGTILLYHGYSETKSILLPEGNALYNMGFNVFFLDFRGSGESDGNVTSLGYREADDVASSYQAIKEKNSVEPIILYGRSMGSAAILRAIAVDHIHPQAIILECPYNTMLDTVNNRFASMHLPSFPAAHLMVFWGGVQFQTNPFRETPVKYAAQIQTPVLLLHGEKDPRVTLEQANQIFSQFKGTKELHVFKNVKHESYFKSYPQEWKETVEAFNTKVTKQAGMK